MIPTKRLSLAILFALFLSACGAEPESAPPAANPPTAGAAAPVSYLLKADLTGTIPVMEALKGAEGQEVSVSGKLQRKVRGRALFWLTDESIQDCTECGMAGGCKTPWDYCCHVKEMKAGTILVELRGADGKPAPVADLGLRELDVVAVKGTLTKGEGGRLMLLAKDGWYRRQRPDLPANLKWPQ